MPPPEATMIENKRKSLRPIPSVRRTAPLAGISEGRWRQVAAGTQRVGGVSVPVRAPAATVVRMLYALGEVTAEERELLTRCRPDAAALLDAGPDRVIITGVDRDLELAEAVNQLRAVVALATSALASLTAITEPGRAAQAALDARMQAALERGREQQRNAKGGGSR